LDQTQRLMLWCRLCNLICGVSLGQVKQQGENSW
jgi:hypothetical protein